MVGRSLLVAEGETQTMTCIRSVWWDGLWIWSGIPLGVVVAALGLPLVALLPVYLWLNTAHLVAPIALAWRHAGFRRYMLNNKVKFVYLPMTIIAACGILGATVSKTFQINPMMLGITVSDGHDYLRPFVMLFVIYLLWNGYHFAMQNYGLLRIYCRSIEPASAMEWAMFITLGAFLLMSKMPMLLTFLFVAIGLSHQTAAIGLASHVWGSHCGRHPVWFAAALLLVGAGLAWSLWIGALSAVAMTIFGLRLGSAFVHFLYDRWLWQLSNPAVGAIIGRDLTSNRAALTG
jgi:hypothetical protein